MNVRDTVISILAWLVLLLGGILALIYSTWVWLLAGATTGVLLWLLPVVLNVVAARHPRRR